MSCVPWISQRHLSISRLCYQAKSPKVHLKLSAREYIGIYLSYHQSNPYFDWIILQIDMLILFKHHQLEMQLHCKMIIMVLDLFIRYTAEHGYILCQNPSICISLMLIFSISKSQFVYYVENSFNVCIENRPCHGVNVDQNMSKTFIQRNT